MFTSAVVVLCSLLYGAFVCSIISSIFVCSTLSLHQYYVLFVVITRMILFTESLADCARIDLTECPCLYLTH